MEVLKNARCANCNTRLDGPFCHNCGQREEPRVPSVRSVLGEVTNALFGLESKLWRSLWVLVTKPGQLTQKFLAGKRQKYTTPFRLYLLLSIVVFAYISFTGSGVNISINKANENKPTREQTSAIQKNQEAEEESSDTGSIDFGNLDNLQTNISFLSEEQEQAVSKKIKESLKQVETDLNDGKLKEVIQHFIAPLPKALLIFLPIIALFFKVIFLGRGKYYLEHLVYLLHNHAFLFAMLILTFTLQKASSLAPNIETPLIILTVVVWVLYIPYYFYRSLRVVYESGRFASFVYWLVVLLAYIILFLFMIILTVLFSGYTYT